MHSQPSQCLLPLLIDRAHGRWGLHVQPLAVGSRLCRAHHVEQQCVHVLVHFRQEVEAIPIHVHALHGQAAGRQAGRQGLGFSREVEAVLIHVHALQGQAGPAVRSARWQSGVTERRVHSREQREVERLGLGRTGPRGCCIAGAGLQSGGSMFNWFRVHSPPSPPHTHTCTNTHTHMHQYTHTMHACTHTGTCNPHARTHTHTHTHTHIMHARTQPPPPPTHTHPCQARLPPSPPARPPATDLLPRCHRHAADIENIPAICACDGDHRVLVQGFQVSGFRSKGLGSKGFRSKGFRSKGFRSKGLGSKGFRSKGLGSKGFRFQVPGIRAPRFRGSELRL